MRITLKVVFFLSLLWTTPSVHAAESCELTPLELPLFGGTPVAELATPAPITAGASITEQEATAVLETYVACTNTGDPTLVWAMFTPRWFAAEFADSEEHYLPAFEYQIANEAPEAGEPLILEEIHGIKQLDDGRVAVTATFGSGESQWTDRLILANVDGQWLIDDVELDSSSD